MKRLLGLLLVSLLSIAGRAATITAASCANADVQTAINGASDGDTVIVPSSPCSGAQATWALLTGKTGALQYTKGITLQGPGPGTVITWNDTTANKNFISVESSNTKTFRVTNFTVVHSSVGANQTFFSAFHCLNCSIRLDHNNVTNATSTDERAYYINNAKNFTATQIIDHNTFTNLGGIVELWVSGENTSSAPYTGDYSWSQATTWGTVGELYLENNTFNDKNSMQEIDCQNGGRVTFRYNTINITSGLGASARTAGQFGHGLDSVPNSCYSITSYRNTVIGTYNGVNAADAFTIIRGGMALIYENSLGSGSYPEPLYPVNYRDAVTPACGPRTGSCTQCAGAGALDQNTAGNDPNTGLSYSGWHCMEGVGTGVSYAVKPIYQWCNNNTNDLPPDCTHSLLNFTVANPANYPENPNHITSNRDKYEYNASFDGTSGVGRGLAAARPATCTTNQGGGVGYFATDTGVLSTCTATNTWTTYYTEYTYPYPGTVTTAILTIAGNGNGTVTSNDGFINCTSTNGVTSGSCSHDYFPSGSPTLTAVASGGQQFTGWTGGGCSGTGTCSPTITTDTTITASFSNQPIQATISASSTVINLGASITLTWTTTNVSGVPGANVVISTDHNTTVENCATNSPYTSCTDGKTVAGDTNTAAPTTAGSWTYTIVACVGLNPPQTCSNPATVTVKVNDGNYGPVQGTFYH